MQSQNVMMILMVPSVATPRWYPHFLSMLVEEPLQLPQRYNFLVNPLSKSWHQGLNDLKPHTRKLSSVLSKREDFLRKLFLRLLSMLGSPKPSTIRASDQPFFCWVSLEEYHSMQGHFS